MLESLTETPRRALSPSLFLKIFRNKLSAY